MCKVLPFTRFYGLVIVPVLATMLAFPAAAQTSSNSETKTSSNPRPKAPAPSSSTLINPDRK
jgi:hypothetical protein